MQPKDHWERVYSTRLTDQVSWYQKHAERSLHLIQQTGLPLTAAIIDVGGGASTLVDDLLYAGYSSLTVLDLTATAIDKARIRLGKHAQAVTWIEANITQVDLPLHGYDVWHDRAVFHFLTSEPERKAYIAALIRAVKPGGHSIIATFAEDGPLECSGLPVVRYSPAQLHTALGPAFALLEHETEEHYTPLNAVQKFIYCHFCKLT